jgi:plastocyanin
MRKLTGLVLAGALAAGAALPAAASSSASRRVNIGDFFFSPKKLAVHRGTKVTWHWVAGSGIQHTVTVRSGPVHFSSPLKSSGTYSHVFSRRGTYHLYCKIHSTLMSETVVVR